jgi:hypothetical protein
MKRQRRTGSSRRIRARNWQKNQEITTLAKTKNQVFWDMGHELV